MIEQKQRVQQLRQFDVEMTQKNPRREFIDISLILKVESTSKFPRRIHVIISMRNFDVESMADRQRYDHQVLLLSVVISSISLFFLIPSTVFSKTAFLTYLNLFQIIFCFVSQISIHINIWFQRSISIKFNHFMNFSKS